MENIIKRGIDTFDCTVPTHYGRRGIAFTDKGKLDIRKSHFLNDKNPLDQNCECPTCQNYKRNYICHLTRAREITGMKLITIHNLYYFNTFVEKIREKNQKRKIIMKTNPVRRTTLYVVKHSKDVKINYGKIKSLAEKWSKAKLNVPKWPSNMHFSAKGGSSSRRKKGGDNQTLTYLILLDALNFCFWPAPSPSDGPNQNKRWEIKYKNKKYDGYFALSLALREFFIKNHGRANFNYLKNISFAEFRKILQGGKNLQFLKKRWQITRKISAYILKNTVQQKILFFRQITSFLFLRQKLQTNFILLRMKRNGVVAPRYARGKRKFSFGNGRKFWQ